MDYRKEAIKILVDGIDGDGLTMTYGMARAARRDMERRKEAGSYVQPRLSRRMEVIRLLMEIDEDDRRFLDRMWTMLKRHAGKRGRAV